MTTRRTFLHMGLGVPGLALVGPRFGLAAFQAPANAAEMTAKAVEFLRSRQGKEGSWSGDRGVPGVTALVVTALLRSNCVQPDDPAITKALAYLEKYIGPHGGLSESRQSVYSTSVALMAFHEANKGGKYDAIIKGSQDFLKGAQYDEDDGKNPDDPHYGGMGYGDGNSRPDLSNTAFMMEALRDSGIPADDPALKKAIVFVSRCQNLKSEYNDQPFAEKVNDGGFIYTSGAVAPPPGRAGAGREAEAAKTRAEAAADAQALGGGIRSTAGMTYSGLKSMLYAGLSRDDLRVQAALRFIAQNYSLESNPGGGQRGLYYYYLMFARALETLGDDQVVDAQGKSHDWRADLIAALAQRQQPSGAWSNPDDRFMEGDPNIVTSYALMALAAARPKK